MNISVGIVGFPNVGKSTLFNALVKKHQAFVANYPFATIEPNIGIVPVLDERLIQLQKTFEPLEPPIVPAVVKFIDIAGLVKGASLGQGLGNKFLSYIREVNVIVHVVRIFEDANVIKDGVIDAKSDYEIINSELMLADLKTLESIQSKLKGDKAKTLALEILISKLDKGEPIRKMILTKEEDELVQAVPLLSAKKEIVILNVSESDYTADKASVLSEKYAKLLGVSESTIIVVCAKIEEQLSDLSEDEQKTYLKELGFVQSGLERLIVKAYDTLGLISFLTAGEKEIRAWTIAKQTPAFLAAGAIHTDFIKGFIRAEVVNFNDFIALGGWKHVREKGKARLEGRDYLVKAGDVVEFKINA